MKCVSLVLVTLTLVPVSAHAATTPAQIYAAPHFTDPGRRQKLNEVLPEIDRTFAAYAAKKQYPGLVWGIILDGELVHTGALGLANVEKKHPAGVDTRFRIASMTKSFTALAVLKLRDAGKLGLYDPVEKHIPEFREITPLTVDSPVITVRHLLTMTAGFPQDDPWGDRQLAASPAELRAFIRDGLSVSNPPGIGYEYSNLGYALLGQIISQVAGEPYQHFITREILVPLGMKDTRWEFSEVPADKLALGYRITATGWQLEPMLHDGTYGAMGGLITTINDFARYVRLELPAWPARNDPDDSLVRRATLREMHKPAEIGGLDATARNLAGETAPLVAGYGYGLRLTVNYLNVVSIGHSGGLPGFGSNWVMYPEHGIGIISFANLTYAGTGAVNANVGAILLEKANLPRRTLPPSPILETRTGQVAQLVHSWDSQLCMEILAENFFLDRPREEWIKLSRETLARAGIIKSAGAITPENQLRGTFPLLGENGRVDVFFTLTPERDPRVQELRLTFVPNR